MTSPTRSRSSRRARALGALLMVVALSACGGTDEPQPDDPTPTGSSQADPTGSPDVPVPSSPSALPARTTDVLPDGTFQVVSTVELPETDDADARGDAGAIANSETVLAQSRTNVIASIDPATGQQRWQVTPELGRRDQLCPLTSLPPGATRVVVFAGLDCTRRHVLDLATGAEVGLLDDDNAIPPLVLGGRTYVLTIQGRVLRMEADGSTATLGQISLAPSTTDIFGDELVEEAYATTDDHVFVAKIGSGLPPQPRAVVRYAGFRVGEPGDPTALTQLWTVGARKLLRGLDQTIVPDQFGLGATLVSKLDPAGKRYQLAQVDPATGALLHRVVLDSSSPGGKPSFVTGLAEDDSAVVVGHQVYATTVADPDASAPLGLVDSITHYDLAAGTVAWTWAAPRSSPTAGFHTNAFPVALTADGGLLYVGVSGSDDPDLLVELDTATGLETRRWEVPADGARFHVGRFVLAGDLVLELDRFFDGLLGPDFLTALRIA